MIDHLRWGRSLGILRRETGPLNQRAVARGTPVGVCLLGEHRPALAADPFHTFEITGSGRFRQFAE